ncbi:energy-coupling factor transporter transmembrane component T family protein [Corynebacterium rouxii]|uniref:Cobalt ABC transporter permease n=1 Tax=Corynebacterium rouxii TaxID=2719119 RepID=A0A6I8MFA7_9CORY|nr:energy-coupling factor transporter transmembrane component T [Corynebacterium rouxii]VZH86469.1 cobalt ABC transporter permease [Corynebacterium rouxii]
MAARLNPVTLFVISACAVVTVLVANRLEVSVGAWLCAGVLALVGASIRRVFLTTTLLSVPVFAGLMVMYAPFGEVPGWWFFTIDGTHTALLLGMRLLGATAAALCVGSTINTDELMRAVQPRVNPKLLYVIASTLRLYPLAKARLEIIRQTHITRGIDVHSIRGRWGLVLPLVVGLVDNAAQRARPLQRTGIGHPGPRTVLRPVPVRTHDVIIQLLAVCATIAVCIWSIF